MKYFDRVRVISDDYEEYGIKRGDEGHILLPEIRYGAFEFHREDPVTGMDDASAAVKVKDLELVIDYHATDEMILDALPLTNPAWPCKVENGFIVNLLGEKVNKIAYDYDS